MNTMKVHGISYPWTICPTCGNYLEVNNEGKLISEPRCLDCRKIETQDLVWPDKKIIRNTVKKVKIRFKAYGVTPKTRFKDYDYPENE